MWGKLEACPLADGHDLKMWSELPACPLADGLI